MFSTLRPMPTRLLALFAVVAIAAVALVGHPGRGTAKSSAAVVSAFTADDAVKLVTGADGALRFDVAEDGTRFVWSGNPALTDGLPAGATTYVTQGYLYPEGTLDGTNGVLADGSPEFPDKVLGLWTCYGWWVNDPAHAGKSAPWITTHLFSFGKEWGEAMLVSEGYSIDDVNAPLARAIVGGTGTYAGATGVQVETNLGYNPSKGIDVRYEIRLGGA
jgi:hypothetical protein